MLKDSSLPSRSSAEYKCNDIDSEFLPTELEAQFMHQVFSRRMIKQDNEEIMCVYTQTPRWQICPFKFQHHDLSIGRNMKSRHGDEDLATRIPHNVG